MLKKLLFDYLHTGNRSDFDQESNRKIFTVNLFGLVGLVLTGIMGISMLVEESHILAAVLFFASFVYYLGHYYQKVTGNYRIASNIILYSLFVLMVYLVYSGGKDNTGPLWIFMVAPVSLFFGGLKRGLLNIAMFVVIISVVMFFPDNQLLEANYSFEFKTRLLLSFLTITFLSAFYEYSRHESFRFMREMSNKYEQLARLDHLTQLSNRRDAMDKLEYELHRVERNNCPISLLLCDVDFFKKVNDQYGHDAGDKTLVTLARLFEETVRKQDIVARWGGEEFLFILPQTNSDQAQVVANKIRNKVKSISMEHDGCIFDITVSMGIGELTRENADISQSINIADQNLYLAKNNGRDCVYPLKNSANEASSALEVSI